MTDMNLNGRAAARLRSWRRVGRVVSASLGVAAISGAVYLGATAPMVSPVQPPAVAAAVEPAPAVADAPGADQHADGARGARDAAFHQGRRR